MSILCRLKRHAAVPSRLWNGGYYFSRCARCECDLIRRGDRWTEVPKGYQVIWKQRRGTPVDWTPWSADKHRESPRLSELVGLVGVPEAQEAARLVVAPSAPSFAETETTWSSALAAPQRRVA
jgi:hypothetical protein